MNVKEDAATLLEALGITVNLNEDRLLDFICNSVKERIRNETNQRAVPAGLRYMAAEMAAGQYLKWLKDSGNLSAETLDLDAAVKQIQQGDTNITFALGEGSMTPEQRLESLISYLLNGRVGEFKRYRKMLW